jgi:hypothetical protein
MKRPSRLLILAAALLMPALLPGSAQAAGAPTLKPVLQRMVSWTPHTSTESYKHNTTWSKFAAGTVKSHCQGVPNWTHGSGYETYDSLSFGVTSGTRPTARATLDRYASTKEASIASDWHVLYITRCFEGPRYWYKSGWKYLGRYHSIPAYQEDYIALTTSGSYWVVGSVIRWGARTAVFEDTGVRLNLNSSSMTATRNYIAATAKGFVNTWNNHGDAYVASL